MTGMPSYGGERGSKNWPVVEMNGPVPSPLPPPPPIALTLPFPAHHWESILTGIQSYIADGTNSKMLTGAQVP